MFGKADSNEVEEVSGGGRLGMYTDFIRVAGVLHLVGARFSGHVFGVPFFLRIAMCNSETPRHLCEVIHIVKKVIVLCRGRCEKRKCLISED